VENGREILTLTGHHDMILDVAVSLDGKRIATASMDKTAKVWDATSGRELLTLADHLANVRAVTFTSDSSRVITGGNDYTVKVRGHLK